MSLRCWRGCLAMIVHDLDGAGIKGATLVCDRIDPDHPGQDLWLYQGERIHSAARGELVSVADDHLLPLIPRPEPVDTTTRIDTPEDVTP